MVNSSNLHSQFRQSFNSCVLASYAITSNYYTNIHIAEFFVAYCKHFDCPKIAVLEKIQLIQKGIVVTEGNDDEFRYELDFHKRYRKGILNGLQIIEDLHNHSNESAFAHSRNQFEVQYIANVKTQLYEVEKKLMNEDSLLVLAFPGDQGGRHIAVFGYDQNGWYTVETRPSNGPGIKYISSICSFCEPGDGLLSISKHL